MNAKFVKLFLLLIFITPQVSLAQSTWKIKKLQWSEQDEQNWSLFVQAVGQAVEKRKCGKVSQCLKSSNINPYALSDINGPKLNHYADCADFPYYMRAYFAYKNSLPFGIVTEVSPNAVEGNLGKDIRYNPYGNHPNKRTDFTQNDDSLPISKIFNELIPYMISSATYRMPPDKFDTGVFSDLYSAQISDKAIIPGTLIYDPNGHVALIYKVTDDGLIYYVDAHPDNSLTTGLFSPKFARSNPNQGAGFKKFRPLYLEGATRLDDGSFWGGKIKSYKNSELSNYGIEQYWGTEPAHDNRWSKGLFIFAGEEMSFYEYTRNKISKTNLKLNPMTEMKTIMSDICVALNDRVTAVDDAIKQGINSKSHPNRLPENIYGTSGEWESYSTPSRDARLKTAYKDLYDQMAQLIKKVENGHSSVEYEGTDLKQDLIENYNNLSSSCQIAYTNSNGDLVTLNFEQVRQRLFSLSFDPYHCAELRWGAPLGSNEVKSCQSTENKNLWYKAEQSLRNQIERRYDINMAFDLKELLASPLDIGGTATPPETDLLKLLNSI